MCRVLANGLVAALWLAAAARAGAQDLAVIAPLDADGPIPFYVAPGVEGSGSLEGDADLARWALQAWERSSNGALRFAPAAEADALVRVYFVPAGFGQYGEMRPLLVNGKRGAAVFIRPDTDALGPDISLAASHDALLRDTIVYLTCLHELGHAIGLVHTADYDDVMYAFGYGGDIPKFFGRYRDKLEVRDDIRAESGLSEGDRAQLSALYE